MVTNRYIELRRSYTKIVNEIMDSDKSRAGNIKRAGKKLGLLENDTFVLTEEVDSNVLMDYMLFEKNGSANRLIDKFAKHSTENIDENEQLLLNSMLNNHFSIFEVTDIDKVNCTLILFDILGKQNFTLFDIGLSQTGSTGTLFATRIVPIEDVYITSGLTFAFAKKKD